jgi:hypothetical protein
MTDDVVALRLMNQKYTRATKFNNLPTGHGSILTHRSPEYFQKLGLIGINVVNSIIPSDALEKRSFPEIIKFRIDESRAFERLHGAVRRLTSTIQASVWSPEFEQEMTKMIDKDILPEIQAAQDKILASYEKMFGGLLKKAVGSITPTFAVSFWAGLSTGQILSLSCAAAAGALTIALPEIVDMWQARREASRNSLSFLVRFARQN